MSWTRVEYLELGENRNHGERVVGLWQNEAKFEICFEEMAWVEEGLRTKKQIDKVIAFLTEARKVLR